MYNNGEWQCNQPQKHEHTSTNFQSRRKWNHNSFLILVTR